MIRGRICGVSKMMGAIKRAYRRFYERPKEYFAPLDGVRVIAGIISLFFEVYLLSTLLLPTSGQAFNEFVSSPLFSIIIAGIEVNFKANNQGGWWQMDIFFMVAGFLISYKVIQALNRGKSLDPGEFVLDRVLRFWPAMAVATIVAWARYGSTALQSWQTPFFFITNLKGWEQLPLALAGSWSLSVDVQVIAGLILVLMGLHQYKFLNSKVLLAIMASGFLIISYLVLGSPQMSEFSHFYPPSGWKFIPSPWAKILQERYGTQIVRLWNTDSPFLGSNVDYFDGVLLAPWSRFGPFVVCLSSCSSSITTKQSK